MLLAKDGSNVYSNIESNGLQFIRHTLLPWIRRIEDGLTTLLPNKQYVKMDTAEFARADQLSRVRSFSSCNFFWNNDTKRSKGKNGFRAIRRW